MMPLGILAPMRENFLGFLRYSMISCISSFSSSHPATSENLILTLSSRRALDLEKSKACLLEFIAPIRFMMNKPAIAKRTSGTIEEISSSR